MSPLSRRALLRTAFATAVMGSVAAIAPAQALQMSRDLDSFIVGKWAATAWSKYPMGIASMANSPQASLLLLDFQPGGTVTKTVRQSFADGSVKEQAAEVTQWRVADLPDGDEVIQVNNGTASSAENWVSYAVVDGSTIRHIAAGTVLKRTQ